jgi:hypothetical protein
LTANAARTDALRNNPLSLGGNMKNLSLVRFVFLAHMLCVTQAIAATAAPKGAVLTWHNDNYRTGWQQQEAILTTSTANKLGISHTVPLKDQVDAQPLVIPGFFFGSDMAYVADGSNNVYMIRGDGLLFRERNLGAAVPRPLSCGANGPNVGINSTPVIDWASQTLFVMAYVNVNNTRLRRRRFGFATPCQRPRPPKTGCVWAKASNGSELQRLALRTD